MFVLIADDDPDLARAFLESIDLAGNTPESVMTLIRFTEDRYLPFVEEHKRISTFRGYRNMWRRYLKPRCDIMLGEFRTVDGERILASIAKEHKLTSTTLAHIKAFLSEIFRFAKRQGVINSDNPLRDVVLPKGKPSGETHAYSLEEITHMLKVLPEPASTIGAVAAFTGVRKGELRGFVWENYDGAQVQISQVPLEGACPGAEGPTKQSASSSHRATRSAAGLAPMLVRQSRERIDVS